VSLLKYTSRVHITNRTQLAYLMLLTQTKGEPRLMLGINVAKILKKNYHITLSYHLSFYYKVAKIRLC